MPLCSDFNFFLLFIRQVIYSDEDRKFNKDVTVGLIRNELLNLAEYNVHMAKLLDAGRNSTYIKITRLLYLGNLCC